MNLDMDMGIIVRGGWIYDNMIWYDDCSTTKNVPSSTTAREGAEEWLILQDIDSQMSEKRHC